MWPKEKCVREYEICDMGDASACTSDRNWTEKGLRPEKIFFFKCTLFRPVHEVVGRCRAHTRKRSPVALTKLILCEFYRKTGKAARCDW